MAKAAAGGMWVQLQSVQHLDGRTYHRGDWVEVGKQTALRWLESGEARAPIRPKVDLGSGVGVVLRQESSTARAVLAKLGLTLPVAVGDAGCQYDKTLLWEPSAILRPELLPVGFGLLDRWQVAVPLLSYETMAADLGSQAERERTAAVIRDLRVPVYDTRLLFVRRGGDVERLLTIWASERVGGDERLAFLRALWTVKPIILALPATWIKR